MRGEVPHEATLYHRDVPSPPPRTSRTTSLPLVPPFIRPPKLLENLRKRRNERASISPSLYSLSYLIPFRRRPLGKANGSKNGTDPGYAQEHSEERRERKKEEEEKKKERRKEERRANPIYGTMGSFEAEGNEGFGVSVSVPLTCPDSQPDHPLRHARYLYTGCTPTNDSYYAFHSAIDDILFLANGRSGKSFWFSNV